MSKKETESKIKIAVIGAGPSGLSTAYHLSKIDSDYEIDVLEMSDRVGGLSASLELWGQTVDLGPHRFFSKYKRVNELWLEWSQNSYDIVNRKTQIFFENCFFEYPLNPLNALRELGVKKSISCVSSYAYAKLLPLSSENNFEDWAINQFGQGLYKIFFQSYTKKVWGLNPRELDPRFGRQRIQKFSPLSHITGFLKKKMSPSLKDQFAYPHGGTGQLWQKVANMSANNGVNVHLNTEVKSVSPIDSSSIEIETNKSKKTYDHVVSTMPLNLLINNLTGASSTIKEAARKLKFRNTILIYTQMSKKNLFDDQWIYLNSKEMYSGRITNFTNWGESMNKNSKTDILCWELWCFDQDDLWTAPDELIYNMILQDKEKIDILKNSSIDDYKIIRIPKSYPILTADADKGMGIISKELTAINNLSVIGRYGSFKYNNQDHCVLMGLQAAENINRASDKKHNLWNINIGPEYQEEAMISESGLVPPKDMYNHNIPS